MTGMEAEMRIFRVPQPHLHKTTGQARVRCKGRDYRLGPWGSPQAQARYAQLVTELQATYGLGRPREGAIVLVSEVSARYLAHAQTHYQKNGQATNELGTVTLAIRELLPLFGAKEANRFTPLDLKAARSAYANGKRCRATVNRMTQHIRKMFRWACSESLVSGDTWNALEAVEHLRAGRCGLRDSSGRSEVSADHIEAILPFLMPPVVAMVRLQLLTSARPGEICAMRPIDVDLDAKKWQGCWLYRPAEHKTEHHGKRRLIFIGPSAQAVLVPFLERDAEAYCFSPTEAAAARGMLRYAKGSRRRPGECYTNDSYRRAIARACEAAEVPVWTPHQLRHTRSTELDELAGDDAARCVNGHATINMTKRYTHRDARIAAETMARYG